MTEEKRTVTDILNQAESTLVFERLTAFPEPTPYARYLSAKGKLERPYRNKLLWESNNYNASCLFALKDFIGVVEAAKKTFEGQFTEISIAAFDGYIQASAYKQVPLSTEELAEAQAIVDAGPPPIETVQWRRPVKFQLNDAPSWNDPRGYTEMNPEKEEE